MQAARGGLAAALGLPANLPFDLAPMPAAIPVGMISLSVDSVINAALRNRPDLAAARAHLDEMTWEALWDFGQALSWEQAADVALQE